MMGIPNATHQGAVNGVRALLTTNTAWISLHTGAGAGTTGANEATGGGYARASSVLGAPTAATPAVSTGPQVNIPCAAGTYTEGGIFTAVTAGTFIASAAFTAGSVVVSGAGASINVTPSVSA
jgi:hypothetical protein